MRGRRLRFSLGRRRCRDRSFAGLGRGWTAKLGVDLADEIGRLRLHDRKQFEARSLELVELGAIRLFARSGLAERVELGEQLVGRRVEARKPRVAQVVARHFVVLGVAPTLLLLQFAKPGLELGRIL